MAHANGRIYIDTSTTPHGGVSIADLQSVLSLVSYNDLGGIIDHANINKWAKFKPTEHNYPTNTTDALRKAALYGMPNIPVYTSASALTAALRTGITAGSHWPLVKPTTWYRLLDFNGYLHFNYNTEEWGEMGVQTARALNFPFAGRILTSDDVIRPYSLLTRATLEPADPEQHPTGLLYPSDWEGTTIPFPDWYFGVLCTPATVPASGNTDLWIVTTDTQLKDYDPGDDMLTDVLFTQGETLTPLGLGNFKLFPILCSRRTWDGQGYPHFVNYKSSWSGEGGGPGKLVLVDGYFLPIQLVAAGGELGFTFSVSNGNVTISIKNNVSVPITLSGSQMFGYIVTDYVAGRYSDIEEVEDACEGWQDSGTVSSSGVKNENNVLVGRYIDLYAAFRSANNNSNVIPANATVTFSVAIGASADGYSKPYNGDSEFYICLYYAVESTNPERKYYVLEQ